MASFNSQEFVRQFRENGLKMLLRESANVRDLLMLKDPVRAARIDFTKLTVEPTSYVAADYRHLCSDIVLKVAYRGRRRTLTLYILSEHQSEPDQLITLRVLEYVVHIYKAQFRQGRVGRGSLLQPVLPLVLYTGERDWPELTTLNELIAGGTADFADVVPVVRPLFLSLPALAPTELETHGGFLGWILGLLTHRYAATEEYRAQLRRVVDHLQTMAESERDRWLLLLSYVQAMAYHDRTPAEREPLRQVIVNSVRTDPERTEIEAMTQTIAEALIEEGHQRGLMQGREEGLVEGREEGARSESVNSRREILLRQLRQRFRRVPRPIEQIVRKTDDVARLDLWLDKLWTVGTLAEVGIGVAR